MFSFCDVNVHCLPTGPIGTNAYLITEPRLRQAVLVDAPLGVWEVVEHILKKEGCQLSALWLTHGHWDHTQGAAEVARKANVPVSGHKADQPLYETPEVMRSRLPASIVVEAIKVDHWLADGDSVEALGQTVKVSHVPGHCPGSLMFYFPAAKVAFGGDALFKGSVGRTDLPGSDRATLENSIRTRFYTLPDDTTVLSGHGEATTVGEEKESNPYVRG